jgi:hypothetical protein
MVPRMQLNETSELSPYPKLVGLPYDDEVSFHDSSFFQKHDSTSLPTPNVVRDVASRSTDPRTKRRNRPPPAHFPSLGLCVKYGTEVTIAEGQCLLFVRSKLPQEVVLVPEVYGWCKDDGQVFIYMELMDGVTIVSLDDLGLLSLDGVQLQLTVNQHTRPVIMFVTSDTG